MSDFDRAGKARALLNDPIFNEAFDSVEEGIHRRWAATPLRDKDGAHELRIMLKLLKDVRSNIERVAKEGKSDVRLSRPFLAEL